MHVFMYACMHECVLSPIEPTTLNLLRDCVSPLTSTVHGIPCLSARSNAFIPQRGKCYEARLSASEPHNSST